MVKLTLNQSINEDQFALEQPPGSILVNLDDRNRNASATGTPAQGATAAAPTSSSNPHP